MYRLPAITAILDKDENCLTADLSNIGRPSGSAYSTGELLNTPLIYTHTVASCQHGPSLNDTNIRSTQSEKLLCFAKQFTDILAELFL